jgi:hypothetical protein
MKSRSTRKRNPAGAYRWPAAVVQHGKCIEVVVEVGDGTVRKFNWPKTGQRSMWLLTDTNGTRLMICRYNKVPITDEEFIRRLRAAGGTAENAIAQWMESTGTDAAQGAISKLPERRIENIGRCLSLAYYFDAKHRDRDPREHRFSVPPLVKADNKSNPALIVISGGRLEVTRRGIEG